jgi:hypothetical protein
MRLRLVSPLTIDVRVFEELAAEQSWMEARDDGPEDEDAPSKVWQVPGGTLRFVDDQLLQVQYVEVCAVPCEPVLGVIERRFTGYDRDDCLAALDLGMAETQVTHGVRLLAAVSTGSFDQRVYDATVAAMRDTRDRVRYWALKVANYTRWPQFLDEARRLEERDPSQTVRSFAGNTRVILELSNR